MTPLETLELTMVQPTPINTSGPVSFEEFAQVQLPRLLAYAVVLTRDRHLAADIVQDAMVNAQLHWSRVQRANRPELYVKRMVTNAYLSWRRRWQVRAVAAVADATLESIAPATSDNASNRAERDDLWQRLEQLPRRQRVAVVLRYYEDLDDADIAEVMGIRPASVRSSISRALVTLRLDIQEGSSRER